MTKDQSPEDLAAYYRKQALLADGEASRAPDQITSEAFRKIASQWRALAEQLERRRRPS